MHNHILLFIFLILISSHFSLKIAIVGSGIGGSSAAYFLLKNYSNRNLQVDIYEKDDRIGGRIYSREFLNKTSNFGASFFIKENKLIYSIIQDLEVPHETADELDSTFGFFKNNTILIELGTSNIINLCKLFWYYGLSPLRTKWLLDSHLKKFLKIYDIIEDKNSTFKSVQEFLEMVNLKDLINQNTRDFLINNSIGEKYVDDMINGFIAGIYNQHSEINAVASFVTLAGISYQSYKIKGGNDLLVKKIIEKLQSYGEEKFRLFLNTKIEEITKLKNGKYEIITKQNKNEIYDYVIMASPIEKTLIKFNNIKISSKNKMPKIFQVNYLTTVKGRVNSNYFGYEEDKLPLNLYSTNKMESFNITEILEYRKAYNESTKNYTYYYRIQGDNKISNQNLEEMGIFKKGSEVVDIYKWDFAYPKLDPIKIEELPEFKIDDRIYHINAIETLASCMEMSIISSKNIIKIIENEISSNVNKNENIISKDDL